MNTATFIKELKGWTGDARLYKVDPPMGEGKTEFVVVSAVDASHTGPETLIFPSDADGKNVDYCELDGSRRGTLSHEEVLGNAGYQVTA